MMRDIGANLTGRHFAHDLEETLDRAVAAGVGFIDITGTDEASSAKAELMASSRPDLLGATAGIHPHGAKHFNAASQRRIADLLARPRVLMCGEMGLDYARNYSTPEEQRRAFEAQLELASHVAKPLFLHCREAFSDFVAAIDRRPSLWAKSIVHCFTGDANEAAALVERGAHIGITGWIADKRRNAPLLAAMARIPLERIMIETDAPYLMPINKPKSQTRDRNEPAHLPWVAQAVAQALGVDAAAIAKISFDNAERLIGRGLPALGSAPPASPRAGTRS